MTNILRVFTLLLIIFAFTTCDNDDADYSFQYTNYSGTVTYPDGEQFQVTSIQFMENRRFQLRIMVPASTIIEEGESPYITAISGEYEYTRNGNQDVLITLNNDANISYGTVAESKTYRTVNLQSIFPIKYELIFDRNNDKNNDKINSLESSTGIKIVAGK